MNEGRQQHGFGGFSSGIWETNNYEWHWKPFIQSHQFISHSWHNIFIFDLLSLKTRGIGWYKNVEKFFNYLKKYSSHNAVIFLQETHSTKIVEKVWLNQWGCGTGNITFSHAASDSRGVLIAFREGLGIEIRICTCDKNGRYIILHAHIQDSPIPLVNYYAPNDESTQVQTL